MEGGKLVDSDRREKEEIPVKFLSFSLTPPPPPSQLALIYSLSRALSLNGSCSFFLVQECVAEPMGDVQSADEVYGVGSQKVVQTSLRSHLCRSSRVNPF